QRSLLDQSAVFAFVQRNRRESSPTTLGAFLLRVLICALRACLPPFRERREGALMIKPAFRTAFVLTSTVAMTAGLMSVPANAAPTAQARIAALPTCDHFSVRKVQKGTVRFPSVGADTKQTNCKLQYGNHNWGVENRRASGRRRR